MRETLEGEVSGRPEPGSEADPEVEPGPRRRRLGRPALVDFVAGVLGLLLALVPVGNTWRPAYPVDDAYISFSYALHLASGRGMRLSGFGPPAEAFSDPLWVFVLAVGQRVGIPIPTLAMILGVILVGLTAAAVSALVGAVDSTAPVTARLAPGILFALLPGTAFAAVAGLETLLFGFLLVVTVVAWLTSMRTGRMSPAAHISGLLLALTRPEGGLIWLTLLLATVVITRRMRDHLAAAAWFVVPAVVLESARLAYYGQLLPNSVAAKSGYSASVARRLMRGQVTAVWHQYWVLLLAGLAVGAAAWLVRGWLPQARTVAVVGLVFGAFETAVSAGDSYPYERYFYAGIPLLLALVAAGMSAVGWAPPRGRHRPRQTRWSVSPMRLGAQVALMAVLSVTGLAGVGRYGSGSARYLTVQRGTWTGLGSLLTPDRLSAHIGTTYHYTLAELLRRAGGRPVVAASEVGIISYYSSASVIDTYGLGNAHIAHLEGHPTFRADPAYLFGHRPDDIVMIVSNCLCVGLPSDVTYVSSDQMERYRIGYLLYDGRGGAHPWLGSRLSAVVFVRDPSIVSVTPLETGLPASATITTAMPPTTKAALDRQLPVDPPDGIGQAPPAVLAAGNLAFGAFRALPPGASATVPVRAVQATGCQVEATVISDGAGSGSATLQLSGGSGAAGEVSTTVPGGSVRTISLPAPGAPTDLTASFHVGAGALLASPRLVCRR